MLAELGQERRAEVGDHLLRVGDDSYPFMSFSGTKIERRKRTGVPSRRIASAAVLARALTACSSRHPPSGVAASSV